MILQTERLLLREMCIRDSTCAIHACASSSVCTGAIAPINLDLRSTNSSSAGA